MPECGVGLDSVALAYFESVLLHNFRGLAYHLAAKQCKTPDRKLPAWTSRSCLGTPGGKRVVSGYVGERISVENQTRMVRSRDRVAYRHISSIHVRGTRAFLGESTSAICAIARNQLSCTPLRPAMGGDSVESLRIEEAPMSLFAALVRLNCWRLLGTMAYTDVGVNCDLPHSSVFANLLCKSCCMVRYRFLLVRPKRAEPASYDSRPLNNSYCAKPRIFRSDAWRHLYQSNRSGVICLLGHDSCRKTEVDLLPRCRTKLSMISDNERLPLCP